MSETIIRPAWRDILNPASVIDRSWLRTVQRAWWVVLLILAAALGTAFILTARQTPLYRSATTIAVAPSATISDPNEVVRSLDTLERRTIIATLARIASTSDLIDQAAGAARMPVADARRHHVTGTVLPNTNLLRISVEGADRQRAADLANAAAVALGAATAKMYRVYELNVVARATPADEPFFPEPARNYAVALVAGLVAAAGALFVLHRGYGMT